MKKDNMRLARFIRVNEQPIVDQWQMFFRTLESRRVTVARIYELANAMEEAYARAGYVLVRVTVPEQKLNDHGPLKIVVVDGFIEKVQVDNVPERVHALVAARMARSLAHDLV